MRKKTKKTCSDVFIIIGIILIIIITLYPVIYVVSMSFSDPTHVLARDVYLLPKGFSLKAYKMIFKNDTVLRSFGNTLWYTFVGGFISVLLTAMTAYPLARKQFFLRKQLSFLMTLTMFISGGLIPLYILVQKLHLYNTRWSIILPYIISAYNLIITRSFYESLPEEMADAVKIDGGSEFTIMTKVFNAVVKAYYFRISPVLWGWILEQLFCTVDFSFKREATTDTAVFKRNTNHQSNAGIGHGVGCSIDERADEICSNCSCMLSDYDFISIYTKIF